MKYCVYVDAFQFLAVGFKLAWVGIVVFVWAKLDWVNKDGGDDYVAVFFGGAHEGEVAFV